VAGVVGLSAVPFAITPSSARAAEGPAGAIAATAEAYALRVEYDIPLPVGTGTVGRVAANVTRAPAGESAHGIAGAPTELDPVVSGRYIDPTQTGKPQREKPQAECYYPGALLSTRFVFPTDTQPETSGLPPTSYAVANCGAGPTSELHAHNGPVSDPADANPGVAADAVSSDALARPDHDVLQADATTRATGISLAGGALRIGSVVATGGSSTTGLGGGGKSRAAVSIGDIRAGDTVFSLSSVDAGDGTQQIELTSGGRASGADSAAGKAILDAANAALKPAGCNLAVMSDPARYPQGFVFSRPEPEVGVRKDGSLAATHRGGLVIVCDLPDNPVAEATQFSPQRIQAVVGFVYTSTAVDAAVGGFGLGDIAGGPVGPVGIGSPGTGIPLPPGTAGNAALSVTPATGGAAPAGPSAGAAGAPPVEARQKQVAALDPIGMGTAARVLLGLACLAAWGALTHVGATRFRRATAPCPPGPGANEA
jgi:hypothetical protein